MTINDPRTKNKMFSSNSLYEYLQGYVDELQSVMSDIPAEKLDAVLGELKQVVQSKGKVFVAGNGGSAAISDHLCCDWAKGTHVSGKNNLQVFSLTSNTALLTAISNDFGYEKSFSHQLELNANAGDILILISSSGNSPNIIAALETAHALKMRVIGFCGFSGGALKEKADVSIHIPFENYGVVEDAHQIIMHSIAQFLTLKRDN